MKSRVVRVPADAVAVIEGEAERRGVTLPEVVRSIVGDWVAYSSGGACTNIEKYPDWKAGRWPVR